jgi:hypothetical protein
VSRAAEVVKNRPSPSRYASRIRSPVKEIGAEELVRGMNKRAVAAVTSPTTGPARKIHVVAVKEPFEIA